MTDILVYIPDLPREIPQDDLEDIIKTRIKANQRMTLKNVKCYLQLGVAVIQMMNEEDKNQLVLNAQSIVLDSGRGIYISFVNELELDTYIVIDQNISNTPSAKEVARQYAQAYKTSRVPDCQSVSVQFPNIFRIFLSTLDELIQTANTPAFRIESVFATVYSRADCSFFEDLPPHTNDEKIVSAIATQIGENKHPPTSFHVQCNKQAANAIVLASKSVKKWMMEGHLTIDGRNISKKAKLAYRILLSPVPRGSIVDPILQHMLFTGRVVSHNHIDDKLIVELNNFDHYNNCIRMGGFGLGAKMIAIQEYTAVTDPDTSELDALNWYETRMLDMKPDITIFIKNYQHPIFRYKWNADNWVQQMKKAEITVQPSTGYDLIRHLLRVTVMLTTIGVLRKRKYVVDDEEVTLKLERMRTIGYDHQAKLLKGKTIAEAELKTPYPSTTVKVINEDCLVLYEQLVNNGCRPVLLNMANAINPGGGYRKGDGAQEENICRRSDYYHSLDGEIADSDRSERLVCTSKCELKPHRGYGGFYPMEDFGAIYTSGITVFRGTEANGYPYMKNPLYNVCAIAMPAYRNPRLIKDDRLENRPAMNTHRKIQNIFAIGYQHKHDCLVLSALGCGAFKNPPIHMALLFKSVIYQYAGYFDKIYFAIIDDHNTRTQINPDGNFLPFKQILDGLIVEPPKTLRVDGVSGPHRILDKTSHGQITLGDACISYLPPCQHGTNCRDLNKTDHNNQYSHPPRCSLHTAISPCDQMDDEVHTFTFFHTTKCKNGGECSIHDPAHLNDSDHPDFCQDGSICDIINLKHLLAYRHLPICQDGMDCSNSLVDHMKLFRHCKAICPDDNCCNKFHDNKHMNNMQHSFCSPCPFTPYKCSMYIDFFQAHDPNKIDPAVKTHCLKYSHICPYGRQCKTTGDKHYKTTIHIARQLCPDGDNCTKVTKEDHLESFTHPGIRDIRLFCRNPGFECRQRLETQHMRIYRHGQNYHHLTVAPSSNLNSHINFVQNQGRLIRNVNTFIDISDWTNAKILQEILNWIRALQPVHRCSPLTFESVLVHGHVMSRHYMTLLKRPTCVTNAVLQHSAVRSIFLKHNSRAVKENAFSLIKTLVKAEFARTGADGITTLVPNHEEKVNVTKMRLKASLLSEQDLQIINDWTVKIAQASIALHNAPMGIRFNVDQKMGTDKHVFSILGPHLGYRYGDIVIIFKPEIMSHPDANFSPQAATSFYSGRTYNNRAWATDPGTEEKRIEDFHCSKLHCSVPRYERAAATELIALTGKDAKSMDVDLNAVIQRWYNVDSHHVFEGHLPQLIPIDYVDCIYMPKNVFESLTPEAQQSAKETFKNSLIITNYVVDLSLIQPNGTIVSLDETRKPYLQYIFQQLLEKIQQRMNTPRISRGIVITVPGSKFEEHIVLPIPISRSYRLYRLDKKNAPENPAYTYIYWQAMHGDMMLTIANQKIEPHKNQPNLRCLICYVAEKPSRNAEVYHEEYSYLNDGHPFQHDINVDEGKFRAKSNVFYRGCNTDDFFTFCLKLSHKTGEVTLSHAGSNSIYNHEKIHYRFSKVDLDLSRIDYVHVSGGNQDVPIRNLTINHEQVPELHPLYDTDFEIDTSKLLEQLPASPRVETHVLTTISTTKDPDPPKRKDPDPVKRKDPDPLEIKDPGPRCGPILDEKKSRFRKIKKAFPCVLKRIPLSKHASEGNLATSKDYRSRSNSTLNDYLEKSNTRPLISSNDTASQITSYF